jgi:hypothetical protein
VIAVGVEGVSECTRGRGSGGGDVGGGVYLMNVKCCSDRVRWSESEADCLEFPKTLNGKE